MDGNNGIDPEPHGKLAGLANAHEHDDHYPHGDVDHNLGTLPFRDFVLDPIAPAYRGRLLLSDPYPLFLDPDPDALAKLKFDWDKLAHLEPRPDIHLDRLIDFEPIGIFHYNTDRNFNPHEHASKLTMAIIDRHLQAAYAEIAATLLGATGDDSEGNPDTETKAAPEADDSFDCWS